MALTPNEENVLRRIVAENTPMPVLNPTPEPTGYQERHGGISQLVDAELKRRPGKLQPSNPNDDPAVERRVKHVVKRDETLTEFYARVGLGRAQILSMSRDEIARFAEHAEQNAADGVPAPVSSFAYAPGTKPAAGRVLLVG